MKKQIFSVTIGLLLLIFISCTHKGDDKTTRPVISKNIEYDVSINNIKMVMQCGLAGSGIMWYYDNLETSVRSAFIELLFKKAKEGKLELYDMNDKLIDTNKIKSLLISSIDTITRTRENPPYKKYDTIINNPIEPGEITALRFREEWTYDPSTMAISKKVLAYAPLWTPIIYDKDQNEDYAGKKPLFWVKSSKEPSITQLLTNRIVYSTQYIGNFERIKAKNADSIAIQNYMNMFLEKVFKDSIKAYFVSDGDLADEEMYNGKEWNKILNSPDIRLKRKESKSESKSYDTIFTKIKNGNISVLRFMEEWSFDPFTMAIQKKVVGICPVKVEYEEDMTTIKGMRWYFWSYFSDVWMPLYGKLELKKKK